MHLRDLKQYLSELSENNARPWFIMNKPRYDILREEFQEVVTDLIRQITLFDKQVASTTDTLNLIAQLAPGGKTRMTLIRKNRESTLDVTVGKRPKIAN